MRPLCSSCESSRNSSAMVGMSCLSPCCRPSDRLRRMIPSFWTKRQRASRLGKRFSTRPEGDVEPHLTTSCSQCEAGWRARPRHSRRKPLVFSVASPAPASAVPTTTSGDTKMKKTLLSAVSAFAIFLAGGVALAQDQDTSGAANGTPETSTQDGASTGPTGTGTTTGADDGATSDAPAGTATDMDTETDADTTDVPAAGDTGTSTGGAATGDDAGTTMPDVGDDDTTSSMTETTTPVDRSEEHTSELQSRGHLVCRL